MRTSPIKLLGLAALMFSTAVAAVGMSGINVTSGLGERLVADIDLVAVTKAEKSSLVARLASPDSYKNAGVEYPYNNKFRFEMASRADGEPYLKISSDQPINDPFVVMMVELNWASGRLVREYTFLLDPPNYVADQPVVANIQPVEPVMEAASEAEPVVEAAVEPVVETTEPVGLTPLPEPIVKPAGKFDIASSKSASTPAKTTTDIYVVQRGDTLAKIAAEDMSSNVSLERTLVALYRANLDEFDGKNMNRLGTGKILRLPSEAELADVKQTDAVTEIRAQAKDWNAYRQKLAGAATVSKQSEAAQQVASGKINSSVADKAPVAKESAKEVLKLSKGEAPGDKAMSGAGGKPASTQEQKNAAKEEAIAQDKALKEGQDRVALLDKNLKDMEKLAQLKVEAAALAKKQAPAVNDTKTTAASAVVDVNAAKPAVKPVQVVKPVAAAKPEPSLLDTVLSEPTYAAGAGAALLGLLGLGWWFTRRKQSPAFEDMDGRSMDTGSVTGRMIPAIAPSPDTGDFTQKATAQSQSVEQHDDVDPLSEADLFLNFGRDAQAEEILKEALVKAPGNHQIHLKLLEIYAKRKDSSSFEDVARQLQDSGDDAAFKRASSMGRSIDPRNTLYGGSAMVEDAGSATMQAPAFNAPKAVQAVNKPAEVDFDLDAAPTGKFSSSPEQHFLDETQRTASMSSPAEQIETGASNLDDLIFDVTGSHPAMPMGNSPAKPDVVAKAADMMEFTLDFPTESVAKAAPVVAAPAMDFGGISFNLDDEVPAKNLASASNSDLWQEVNTKLDLAKAYQEMGDGVGAREILDEVLREGDMEQQQTAQSIIDQIA